MNNKFVFVRLFNSLFMRYILAILLFATCHGVVLAQERDNLYVDVGLNNPGGSVTWDRKLTRHLDVGVGINAYDFEGASYGNFRGACYVDLRPYWTIKRSLLLVIANAGLGMYGGSEPADATMSRVGFYTG